MSVKNKVIKHSVQWFLRASAALSRAEILSPLSIASMRTMGKLTARAKNIGKAEDLTTLGKAWQKGFPSAKQVPITRITEDTVYAEIHTPCPLRGTGDVMACHRMMAYDRAVVGQAGGQFRVLSSQAEAGNNICKVAIRFEGVGIEDLVEPHEKT